MKLVRGKIARRIRDSLANDPRTSHWREHVIIRDADTRDELNAALRRKLLEEVGELLTAPRPIHGDNASHFAQEAADVLEALASLYFHETQCEPQDLIRLWAELREERGSLLHGLLLEVR